MKIAWTRLALNDLDHVRNYIASDKPAAAEDVIEAIARAVETLPAYPNLGRNGRVRGTKELVVVGTPFVIPYRIKKDRFEILAILHSARRWLGVF